MGDRRTRDQLRLSNDKLRAAIRRFVAATEAPSGRSDAEATKLMIEYSDAYRALKELMGSSATDGG